MRSLKSKFTFYLTTILLISLSATAVFIYSEFKTNMLGELSRTRNTSLKEVARSADDLIDRLEFISASIAEDQTLSPSLINTNPETINEYSLNSYLSALYLNNYSYINSYDYTIRIVVICNNGYIYCSARDDGITDTIINSDWLEQNIADGQDSYIKSLPNPSRIEDGNVIAAVKNIRQGTFDEYSASVIVYLDERALYEDYSYMIGSSNNTVYILDDSLKTVSSSNTSEIGKTLYSASDYYDLFHQSDYAIIHETGKEYLYSRQLSNNYQWTVLEKLPTAILMKPFLTSVTHTVYIVILLIVVSLLISVWICSYMTRPLIQFSTSINEAALNQLIQPIDILDDYIEIEELSKNYNHLIRRINCLMDDIADKERKVHESEIAFLRAQISPHFLYNTLFSIKCMIDMGRNKDASKMLTLLNSTLHFSLDQKEHDTSIAKECLYIQKYIELQQLRYGDKLKLVVDIDNEFNKCRILRYLIQPIVENSIFHGIEPLGKAGIIKITCKNYNKDILFEIWDNGIGIQQTDTLGTGSNSHIGLKNIHKRIQLNYGNGYGLRIKPCQNGTCIQLHLPRIT